MDPTHKLPQHLGAWPCVIHNATAITTAPEDGRNGKLLTLVEYDVSSAAGHGNPTRRMYIDPAELERIVPAEPEASYVIGADGKLYVRLPGTEPGTAERLWAAWHGGKPWTWGALTVAWDEQGQEHRVIPLVEDPLTDAPELPFTIYTGDGDSVSVEADMTPSAALPVRLVLADNWTWGTADQAEQIGLALLRAAADVRKVAS